DRARTGANSWPWVFLHLLIQRSAGRWVTGGPAELVSASLVGGGKSSKHATRRMASGHRNSPARPPGNSQIRKAASGHLQNGEIRDAERRGVPALMTPAPAAGSTGREPACTRRPARRVSYGTVVVVVVVVTSMSAGGHG